MLDGLLTNKITSNLNNKIKTGKIQKIYELSNNELLFKIRCNGSNYQLLNSINNNRFSLYFSNQEYLKPEQASNICMVFRKHLEGGIIEEISQYENDRIIIMKINKLNELKDYATKYLVFELLGRHANTLLLDDDYKIIQTLKYVPLNLESNTRLLQTHLKYEYPSSTKLNPLQGISLSDDYMRDYQGISKQVNTIFKNSDNPQLIIDEYINSKQVYVYDKFISFIDHNLPSKVYDDLDLAFDDYYYYQFKNQVNQKDQQITTTLKNMIKKNNRKIKKLEENIVTNTKNLSIKKDGVLIYDNIYLFNKNDHLSEIEVFDYDSNEKVIIKLDLKYSIVENAKRILKKYHKASASFAYIEVEINKARLENDILNQALDQIKLGNDDDIKEIIYDLENKGLLKSKKIKLKKKYQPKFLTYHTTSNMKIYVGKNNLQNDYITFTLAHSNDLWFHVKGYPGAHVVLKGNDFSDLDILEAASIAALYSQASQLNKVEVDYTLVKNIKKAKKAQPGQVHFNTNNSILVNIDTSYLNTLK